MLISTLFIYYTFVWEGLNQILKITDENKARNKMKYNEKVKNAIELLQSLYNKQNERCLKDQ